MIAFVIVIIILILVVIFFAVRNRGKDTPVTNKHNDLFMERIAEAKRKAEEQGDTEALQAIEEDRYDQLMQERAEKHPLYIKIPQTASVSTKPIPQYTYDIAGINYRKGIADYVGDFSGYLKPQPSNRHDPNAIAIYHHDGHHLGYIPAFETANVRALHRPFPIPITGHIDEAYDDYEDRRFYVGVVYIK